MRGGDLGCRGGNGGRPSPELLPTLGGLPGVHQPVEIKDTERRGGPDTDSAFRERLGCYAFTLALPTAWHAFSSFSLHSESWSQLHSSCPYWEDILCSTRLGAEEIMVPTHPTQRNSLTGTVLVIGNKLY